MLVVFRQKSGSKKTQVIAFRVDNFTYDIINALASQYKMSPHEFCKKIVISYLKVKGYIV